MNPPPPDAAAVGDRRRRVRAPLVSALQRARAPAARVRGALALLGPAFVAARRLHRPGQLRHQHRRRRQVRLPAAVGDRRREPDGDARAVPVGQDRHRHRQATCPSCAASTSRARSPVGLWVQAEVIAIATDLAEFVGAAIALNLLFGVPPFAAGLITAVVAFAILALQTRGYRRFELAIAGLLGDRPARLPLRPAAGRRRRAASSPRAWSRGFDGTDSVLLAVGILGATVMPHVVYLHSALTQGRIAAARTTPSGASCCASSASTSSIAMGLAGLINMTMLVVAASLFHDSGLTGVDSIEGAHAGFSDAARRRRRARLRGRAAGLRASSSSSVGTLRRPGRDAGLHQPPHPALRCAARSRWRPRWSCSRSALDPTRDAGDLARSCCRSASRSRSCRWSCSRAARDIMGALVNRRAHDGRRGRSSPR